jgi:hypothetical protein
MSRILSLRSENMISPRLIWRPRRVIRATSLLIVAAVVLTVAVGLTADAATTQSKAARVRLVFRERVLDPGFDQIGNVSPVQLWMAWPHRQAPAPEPAQLRDDLLGFSSLP